MRVSVRSRSAETSAIALIALASAIGAALSKAAPTGTPVWDPVLNAALGAMFVVAASKAPRWSVIFMAAIAAAASFATPWAVGGWLAIGISIVAALLGRRNRIVGATAAAVAIQSLLRLPEAGFFGLQTIVALVAIAPVAASGYRFGTKRARRVIRWTAMGVGAAVVGIGLLGSLSLLNARSDVAQGITAARTGIEAARAGNTEGVATGLDRAQSSFARAGDELSGLRARLLRLVPVVSQHQRAIEAAVSQGRLVTAEAGAAVRESDIRNLRLTGGALDLEALSQMAPRLQSTSIALDNAVFEIRAATSPWLVAELSGRIGELLREIEEFQPEVELGAVAAEVLPDMLGRGGPRTYFVMFGTPAESRELGGFLGSWALLTFDQGQLELGESGRINELYDVAAASEVPAGVVSDWFMEMARPTQFPQNLPSSPDMAQVAAVSKQVLAGATDSPIDGFVYADGFALTDMLQLSGPVTVPFQEEAMTSDSATEFFFADQYQITGGAERNDLFDTLAQVAAGVVTSINGQTLPGPEELGRVMGPAARAGHLQVVTFDEQANDFLRSVKLLRDFGRNETQDFVGLVQTNGLSNKMDIYLHRELDYQVVINGESELNAIAAVTLRSDVPADAPPFTLGSGDDVGVNKVLLSLYSPLSLDSVTLNGLPVDVRIASEFDMGRYLVEVDVPPNAGPSVVEFSLSGSVLTTVPYSLEVWHQPLVNDDDVAVSAVGPDFEISWDGKLVENLVVSADPDEAS